MKMKFEEPKMTAYETPSVSIVKFSRENVITDSGDPASIKAYSGMTELGDKAPAAGNITVHTEAIF